MMGQPGTSGLEMRCHSHSMIPIELYPPNTRGSSTAFKSEGLTAGFAAG